MIGAMGVIACIVAAALLVLVGCGSDDSAEEATTENGDAGAHSIPCQVGVQTDYYVPGGPAVVLGCLQLGLSRKTVELSVHAEPLETIPPVSPPIDIVCINPAFPGRGPQAGRFIPSVCPDDPVKRGRTDMLLPGSPYELVVVSAIGGPPVEEAVVKSADVEVAAEVFDVDQALVETIGAKRTFSVAVAELPIKAACGPLTVEADGESPRSVRALVRSAPFAVNDRSLRRTVCERESVCGENAASKAVTEQCRQFSRRR